jgi:uncharacterized protein YacL
MLLIMIRAVFVLVVAGLGVQVARLVAETQLANPYVAFIGMMVSAILVVAADLWSPRKRIQTISAIYFGVIVGLILSNLVQSAFEPTLELFMRENVRKAFSGVLMIFICYICVSTLLQTKDDFRFIIPYMEFSKEVKGARPLVLDTSVVIDGRIADVAETRVIDQPLVVPRFVLQELQGSPTAPTSSAATAAAAASTSSTGFRSRQAWRSRSTMPRSPSSRVSARSTSASSCLPSTWAARWSPTTTTSTRSRDSRGST